MVVPQSEIVPSAASDSKQAASSLTKLSPALAAAIANSAAGAKELILDEHKLKMLKVEEGEHLEMVFGASLEELTMNNTMLRSLENFPRLAELKSLELMDNRLDETSGVENLGLKCPGVRKVLLAGNRFKSLKPIEQLLRQGKEIRIISLEMNPVVEDTPDEGAAIRAALFQEFPQLKVIDCLGPDNKEADENDPQLVYGEARGSSSDGSDDDDDDDDAGYSSSDDESEDEGAQELRQMYFKNYKEGEEDSEDEDFVPKSPKAGEPGEDDDDNCSSSSEDEATQDAAADMRDASP